MGILIIYAYVVGESVAANPKAFFPLPTPVIVRGGILEGVFTPTEAAAVFCALFISLFALKALRFAELPDVLGRAGLTSAVLPLPGERVTTFGRAILPLPAICMTIPRLTGFAN